MACTYTVGVKLAFRPMAVYLLCALIGAPAGHEAKPNDFQGVSKLSMVLHLVKKISEMAALLGSREPGHLASQSISTSSTCSDASGDATDDLYELCDWYADAYGFNDPCLRLHRGLGVLCLRRRQLL
mmetsp:Transcript_89476/g.258110  ORF Transcript_89476/g.258110 Transcript_89476/m.258110 type:complete len:127 (-) Transcript_89476:523-903(-)